MRFNLHSDSVDRGGWERVTNSHISPIRLKPRVRDRSLVESTNFIGKGETTQYQSHSGYTYTSSNTHISGVVSRTVSQQQETHRQFLQTRTTGKTTETLVGNGGGDVLWNSGVDRQCRRSRSWKTVNTVGPGDGQR